MPKKVCLVYFAPGEPCAEHGIRWMTEDFEAAGIGVSRVKHWVGHEKDFVIVAGVARHSHVDKLLREAGVSLLDKAEGVVLRWVYFGAQKLLVASGTDARGLMYALSELGDAVRCGGEDALLAVDNTVEYPDMAIRGADRIVTGPHDGGWLFSEAFWEKHIRMLARCRLNRFTLTARCDDGRTLGMLRQIASLCHLYGLESILCPWPLPSVGDEEFWECCVQGIRTVLANCPDIDGVQLRLDGEADIHERREMRTMFFRRMIDALAGIGRPLKVALCTEGLADGLVTHSIASGLEVSIAVKYGLGLTRALAVGAQEKPHAYGLLYMLWEDGPQCFFRWGDPEHVRRFCALSAVAHGVGYTFREPQADVCGDDRHWMLYLSLGRAGYSRGAEPEVWARELRVRFGDAASAVERAYRFGSRVLPLIAAAHFLGHPSRHDCPECFAGMALFRENNRAGHLNSYATACPGDEQLFAAIDRAVDAILAREPLDAFSPLTVRDWYVALAAQIDAAVADAETSGVGATGEWPEVKADFQALGRIARYHAWMMAAAWHLVRFEKGRDVGALLSAHRALFGARRHWAEVAAHGAWADPLSARIDRDIAALERLMDQNGLTPDRGAAPSAYESLDTRVSGTADVAFTVPETAQEGDTVDVTVHDSGISPFVGMTVYYRHMNPRGAYNSLQMVRYGDTWTARIPDDDVVYAWDLAVYFIGHTYLGTSVMLPGLYSRHADLPFFIVKTVE